MGIHAGVKAHLDAQAYTYGTPAVQVAWEYGATVANADAYNVYTYFLTAAQYEEVQPATPAWVADVEVHGIVRFNDEAFDLCYDLETAFSGWSGSADDVEIRSSVVTGAVVAPMVLDGNRSVGYDVTVTARVVYDK